MYNSNYSRAKFGLEAKDIQKTPKGKSCGYYMRIVFFFSSLIQSLIIVSLVLFLVYGKSEQSAEEQRMLDLQQNFDRVNQDNKALQQQKDDLTQQLKKSAADRQGTEKELAKVRDSLNTTSKQLGDLQKKMVQCETDKKTRSAFIHCPVPQTTVVNTANTEVKILQSRNQHLEAMLKLVGTNFTQTVQHLQFELESAVKTRDGLHLETIELRRDRSTLKEQLEKYALKCKEDFVKSLEGIPTVTKAFLKRIENLFPQALTFHLTCEKQQEQLDRIRYSCSSLSKEIEDKFQHYLNGVGNRVAEIQGQSSQLLVQNSRLVEECQQCRQNRTLESAESKRLQQATRENHDRQMEQILREQSKLRDQKGLQEQMIRLKDSEINTLHAKVQSLGSTCGKASGPKPAGLHSVLPGQHLQNRPNTPSGPIMVAPGIGAPAVSRAGTAEVNSPVKELPASAKTASEVSG